MFDLHQKGKVDLRKSIKLQKVKLFVRFIFVGNGSFILFLGGIVFKNPSKIKENVKTYLLYLRTKDMKEMYFTNEKGDKSDRPYYYLTKKAAYNLFHPFLDIKLLKFPLYYTTKEPKNWSLCRLDNLLFFDKATKNQYLTNSTSLFQSAVRVTSQNVQLLALLKHAEKERIKQEGGGEATEGSSPTTEKQ